MAFEIRCSNPDCRESFKRYLPGKPIESQMVSAARNGWAFALYEVDNWVIYCPDCAPALTLALRIHLGILKAEAAPS